MFVGVEENNQTITQRLVLSIHETYALVPLSSKHIAVIDLKRSFIQKLYVHPSRPKARPKHKQGMRGANAIDPLEPVCGLVAAAKTLAPEKTPGLKLLMQDKKSKPRRKTPMPVKEGDQRNAGSQPGGEAF